MPLCARVVGIEFIIVCQGWIVVTADFADLHFGEVVMLRQKPVKEQVATGDG